MYLFYNLYSFIDCILMQALMSREEKMEMFKARITDCAAKEGASSADVDGIMTEQEPAGGFTREGICIAACMGEVSGMVCYFHL